MDLPENYRDDAIVRMADGTVKQKNLLSGTEVWTVPGRADRPIPSALPAAEPIKPEDYGSFCAFCENRYFETPPEKSRVVHIDHQWVELTDLLAEDLYLTRAEFRRIPNLFEIVSYTYWMLNHNHEPTDAERARMAQYLSTRLGFDHVMNVVKARILASGVTADEFAVMTDSEKLQYAQGFFSGGHDVIVARRHYTAEATNTSQLAGSGTLTPEEHYQYMKMTTDAMGDLYHLDKAVKYVVAFQNWLKPAGASFDHLHKQLVAIDQLPVQTAAEIGRIRRHPNIYEDILKVGTQRNLVVAQNEHAVALAGFGHRYPSLAVWPVGAPIEPWNASDEQARGVSDLLHAMHAATGIDIPSNEEWHHQPPSTKVPVRWRILLKWRISTLAGFEGGTRIYLNTIDPWKVHDRVVENLLRLREENRIACMKIGSECRVDGSLLT